MGFKEGFLWGGATAANQVEGQLLIKLKEESLKVVVV